MSIKRTYLHIVFSVFLLINCGGDNESSQKLEQLSFTVNDSLLGPVFTDSTLSFSFHPPIGWEQVPDTIMKEAKDQLGDVIGQQDNILLTPLQFFIDFQSGSSCCVSRLTGLHMENQIPDSLNDYTSSLKATFPDANIEDGAFRVDGVNVHQFLITNDEQVIFKLLCSGLSKHTFQIDYIVPRLVYHGQVKAIESSIGSFKITPR